VVGDGYCAIAPGAAWLVVVDRFPAAAVVVGFAEGVIVVREENQVILCGDRLDELVVAAVWAGPVLPPVVPGDGGRCGWFADGCAAEVKDERAVEAVSAVGVGACFQGVECGFCVELAVGGFGGP
jgi:hypothetical protein